MICCGKTRFPQTLTLVISEWTCFSGQSDAFQAKKASVSLSEGKVGRQARPGLMQFVNRVEAYDGAEVMMSELESKSGCTPSQSGSSQLSITRVLSLPLEESLREFGQNG